eukprot:371748-Rhodomonas_salina.1
MHKETLPNWKNDVLGIGRSRHQVAPTSAVAPPHGACVGEGGDGAAGGAEAAGACSGWGVCAGVEAWWREEQAP